MGSLTRAQAISTPSVAMFWTKTEHTTKFHRLVRALSLGQRVSIWRIIRAFGRLIRDRAAASLFLANASQALHRQHHHQHHQEVAEPPMAQESSQTAKVLMLVA